MRRLRFVLAILVLVTSACTSPPGPHETGTGLIAGALLYPWTSGVLEAQHASLSSDRPLFVICAGGGRSPLASSFLATNGHTCVHNVSGGRNAWKNADYPTVVP